MPAEANGTVDVRFEIPADTNELLGATVVVFQRIEVEASGRVVAEHVDPTDLDQTVYFPAPEAPPTTAPPTTAPPTTAPQTYHATADQSPPTTAPVDDIPGRAGSRCAAGGAPAITPPLPRTGGNGPLAFAALALVMMGAGLVMTTRRRPVSRAPRTGSE